MDTIALTNFMRRDEKTNRFFKGVMPRDFLPAQLEKKGLYVINLATSTDPSGGTHWVLISTLSDFFSAYVCSLGTKPIHKNVLDSLFSGDYFVLESYFKIFSWCKYSNVLISTVFSFIELYLRILNILS